MPAQPQPTKSYTPQECENAVIEAIVAQIGASVSEVRATMDQSLMDSFGFDSLDYVEASMTLGHSLGIDSEKIADSIGDITGSPKNFVIIAQTILRAQGRLLEPSASHVPPESRTKPERG